MLHRLSGLVKHQAKGLWHHWHVAKATREAGVTATMLCTGCLTLCIGPILRPIFKQGRSCMRALRHMLRRKPLLHRKNIFSEVLILLLRL